MSSSLERDRPSVLNDLRDVNAGSPADQQVLAWDAGTGRWIPQTNAAGGENNTASSAGTGTSLYYQKSGVDLQFNAIKSENNRLTVALDGVTHDVELTVVEGNIDHNALANYAANQHVALPATIAAVLTDHDLAAHTALGLFDQSSDVDHDLTTNYVAAEHLSLPNTIANVLSDHDLAAHTALGLFDQSSDVDHDLTTNYVAAEHLSLPNTIANVLSDHDLAAHTALGLFDASGDVDHDLTTNYVANEHIDHSGVTLTAGTGLSGGGDITANRTFNVDADYSVISGNDVATDVTGAQLEELTDGSTTTLHAHAADITSVGDVASGAAFDGTQGTQLTFYNAGGNATLGYDGSKYSFNKGVYLSAGTIGVGQLPATDKGVYAYTTSSSVSTHGTYGYGYITGTTGGLIAFGGYGYGLNASSGASGQAVGLYGYGYGAHANVAVSCGVRGYGVGAGGGTASGGYFVSTGGAANYGIDVSGSTAGMRSAGHLIFTTDSQYDLGGSTVRVRVGYFDKVSLGADASSYIELSEIAAPAGNPAANKGWLYSKDDGGTTKLYFEDSAGTVNEVAFV